MDLAIISKKSHFLDIKAFLRWAEDIHKVPCPNLRGILRGVKDPPTVFLTKEEAARLLAAVDNLPDKTMLTLLLATGIRSGELCALNREDIKDNHIVTRGKTGEVRVPLTPELRKSLLLLGSTHVFWNFKGQRLKNDQVGKRVAKYMRKAGIDKAKMGAHVLRHTAGHLLWESSHDLRFVQEMLGHKTLAMTQRYTHLTPEDIQAQYREHNPLKLINGGSSNGK